MLVKEIIASERKKRGLSAAQLADIIHVNKGTINRYENGTIKVIPIEVLKRLAEALNYTFDDLVRGDPKYCILADQQESLSTTLSEDDLLILRWYHCLPPKHQDFLKEIAANSYV